MSICLLIAQKQWELEKTSLDLQQGYEPSLHQKPACNMASFSFLTLQEEAVEAASWSPPPPSLSCV